MIYEYMYVTNEVGSGEKLWLVSSRLPLGMFQRLMTYARTDAHPNDRVVGVATTHVFPGVGEFDARCRLDHFLEPKEVSGKNCLIANRREALLLVDDWKSSPLYSMQEGHAECGDAGKYYRNRVDHFVGDIDVHWPIVRRKGSKKARKRRTHGRSK